MRSDGDDVCAPGGEKRESRVLRGGVRGPENAEVGFSRHGLAGQTERREVRVETRGVVVPKDDGPRPGFAELGDRTLRDLAAAIEDEDAVGHLLDIREDMRGKKGRLPALAPRAQDLPSRVSGRRVHARHRLVEYQQVWIAEKGLGQPDPLHHPLGVGPDAPGSRLFHAHGLECIADPLIASLHRAIRKGVEAAEQAASGGEPVESEHLREETEEAAGFRLLG